MEQPKISVIIPAYNSETYLEPCVRSVLQQTYQNLEILLIDDGSTDKTWEICRRLAAADSRIKPIHKQNGGVSSARNAGIEAASGAMLLFVDGDDELKENGLEALIEAQQRTGADIVAAWYDMGAPIPYPEAGDVVWKGTKALQKSLEDHPLTYSVWAKLYTREIIGDTRFQEGIRVNEDSLFVFRLLCKQPCFAGINRVVYFYRPNAASASRAAFSEKYFDIPKVADVKQQLILQQYPQLEAAARNMKLKAELSLLNNLSSCPCSTYRAQEKALLHNLRAGKTYYISATRKDDLLFFLMTHHLYYPFKALNCLRTRLNK